MLNGIKEGANKKIWKRKGGTGISEGFPACKNIQYREEGDASTEKEERKMFSQRFRSGPGSFLTEFGTGGYKVPQSLSHQDPLIGVSVYLNGP